MLKLEGFAEKKADNILDAIEASKRQPLARLITAIGIHGAGEVVAADLAKEFSSMDSLMNATVEQLQSIEGIGPNIAQAIVDWFNRAANQHVLGKLHSAGVWPVELPSEKEGIKPLAGMTFVVTGYAPEVFA